jgi:SAM-dependent methyltransferase
MFDNLTDAYEAMIDWPKRLANESPFYRRWFERTKVRSVVDAACGTGRHAAMFRDWGLHVEGADISPNMIARAKAQFGESADLHWVVRGFDTPITPATPWDAIICVGNSLALASDPAVAARAVQEMIAAVRPGGVVVIQVLNLWKLPDGPCVWQKCRQVALPDGLALILKGVHRCGTRGYVDFAILHVGPVETHQGGAETTEPNIHAAIHASKKDVSHAMASDEKNRMLHTESQPLLAFEAEELERIARKAGLSETHVFGNYQEQTYDRATSGDLILLARKSD